MPRNLIVVALIGIAACASSANRQNGRGSSGDANQTNPPDPNQSTTGPKSPNDVVQNNNGPTGNANTPSTPPAPLTTFTQGLWRGEDVRVSQYNGYYYTVYSVGTQRQMFKSISLIDRGVGKQTPPNFPLYAPQWIDTLGGVKYNAWFAFDGNVWRCDCTDPYDDINDWHLVKSIPFSSVSLDFEVFRNTDPGPFSGHWYMVWAGAKYGTVGWGPESLYIAEVLDLRAGNQTLSMSDNTTSNAIIEYHGWSDVVVEGPGIFTHNGRPLIVYSGNGAQTSDYALGVGFLIPGADPSSPYSWIDHNNGGCDDNKYGPDFARTDQVFGPGVARLTHSVDGSEDWMLYHSKVWDTYQANDGPAAQQSHNQQWTRQVMLQRIGWTQIACDGNNYAIPAFGTPVPPGQTENSPTGDRGLGPLSNPMHTEAESWLPYGEVMGTTIQSIQGPDGDLDVITPQDSNASSGERMSHLADLAQDTNTTPKISGLVWHNAPPAQGLKVVGSSPGGAAQLQVYVNGAQVGSLAFAASADADTFSSQVLRMPIARGATVDLRYVVGALGAPDVDYIDFLP